MKLKRDIYSKFRRGFKYGNAGEKIKLVGAVMIENKYGVRFSVNADDIIQDNEETVKSEIVDNKIPAKKQHSSNKPIQQIKTLF